MHTVAESPSAEQRLFLRRTALRLGGAALLFLSIEIIALVTLDAATVRAWMREMPLAIALVCFSLLLAWGASVWAETERPYPLVVLILHGFLQALLIAPLLTVAVALLGLWTVFLVGVALSGMVASLPRALAYFRADQADSAALAISAAGVNPIWYAGRLIRSVLICRD